MRVTPVVVADTSPINYLILIGHISVLPVLFGKIVLPTVVRDELARPEAPLTVREWLANPPAWLEVRPSSQTGDMSLDDLDDGERSAILLAMELYADLLLIDERRAAKTARGKGFRVAGTIATLGMAARRDLLNLPDAIDRLKRTSFHYRQEILDQFLSEQAGNTQAPNRAATLRAALLQNSNGPFLQMNPPVAALGASSLTKVGITVSRRVVSSRF